MNMTCSLPMYVLHIQCLTVVTHCRTTSSFCWPVCWERNSTCFHQKGACVM